MSFRNKTIMGIVLIQFILLFVLITTVINYLKVSTENEFMNRVSAITKLFVAATKDAIISTDLATLEEFTKELIKNTGVEYVRILDPKDRVLAERGDKKILNRPFKRDRAVVDDDDQIYDTYIDINEGEYYYGKIEIGVSTKQFEHSFLAAVKKVQYLAFFELILSAIFSTILAVYLVKQLDSLKEASIRISSGELGYQIKVKGKDEIARTAIAFNDMSKNIKMMKNALKSNEEILMESEERYRTLIENINLGICLIDKDHKIKTVNNAFIKMFGFTRDNIIGKEKFSIYPDYEKKLTFSITTEKIESECLCKDGSRLPVFIHTFPIFDPNNGIKAFVQIFEDITEYKKVEQAKRNLIRDMSHSLKTPIAITEMAVDIIRRSIDLEDKENIKKATRITLENLGRLRKDVTNILKEFSLDVHKDIIGKEDMNASINTAMLEIANNLKILLEKKNLQLEINISSGADRIKMEDRDIKTILGNLLENAIKFTEKGKISVISVLKDKMVEIEVRDTGCGISAKDINRVFDKFYKRHAAIEGTGLGLSICKELVEMYEGEINISSEGVGKGTAVVVSLPAA